MAKRRGKSGNRGAERAGKRRIGKAARKRPIAFLTAIVAFLALVIASGGIWYFALGGKDQIARWQKGGGDTANSSHVDDDDTHGSGGHSHSYEEKDAAPISFHFLELGNGNTGDATFIKAGDMDILIDAGSNYSSYGTLKSAIDKYCSDGKLELVIATHAHQDHIAGFSHANAKPEDGAGSAGIFYNYQVGQVIDFDLTNSTSGVYNHYVTARNYAISQGAVRYSAGTCFEAASTGALGQAHRVYTLGKNLTLEVLKTRFYKERAKTENDYSVCVLFRQQSRSFLFTGDLEMEGEKSLLAMNSLPEVELFKGGHHGSYNAALASFYDAIKPKKVAVCCCAGNTEYSSDPRRAFPTQEFIDAAAPYTKDIFVTTRGRRDAVSAHAPLNGQINIDYGADGVGNVHCSHADTVLGQSAWFTNVSELWPKQMVITYTQKQYQNLGSFSLGYETSIERNPSKPATYVKGTRCLSEYLIHQKAIKINEIVSGGRKSYEVTYDCLYDYADSSGRRLAGQSTMPNRLWPQGGVPLQ